MAVGPDDKLSFMVVFDNIKYKFKTIMNAIAGVVAVTYVLDLNYNADAMPAWTFVQQHLFEIDSKKRFSVVDDAARTLVTWK